MAFSDSDSSSGQVRTRPPCHVCKGGASFPTDVVLRVLALEAAGGRFTLLDDGHFRVSPGAVLTDDDRRFLREHQGEVRRVLIYCFSERWVN